MTASWMKSFWIWNSFFPCNFQYWNDFPSLSTTMISQLKWKIISLVWIFPEQFITRTVIFLKNRPAKTLLPCLFTSKIRKLQRPRNVLCQLLWAISLREVGFEIDFERRWQDWFGFQVGYQPRKINSPHQNCLPANALQCPCKPP